MASGFPLSLSDTRVAVGPYSIGPTNSGRVSAKTREHSSPQVLLEYAALGLPDTEGARLLRSAAPEQRPISGLCFLSASAADAAALLLPWGKN